MKESDFKLSQRIQDLFLLLCITDTNFLKICRSSVKSSYFNSQVTEDMVDICYSFYDQFKKAPADHFHDELQRFLKRKSSRDTDLYIEYLEKVSELDVPDKSYIVSRINSFISAREFEAGAIKFVELASKGQFDEAKQSMFKTLRQGVVFEESPIVYPSCDELPSYHNPEKRNETLIHTGLDIIDRRFPRGLCRTDIAIVLGGAKGSKTWTLMHLGLQGLMEGKNVLHISHEVSAEDTEMRYDMMHCMLTSNTQPKDTEFIEYDQRGNETHRQIVTVESVYNLDEVMSRRKNIRGKGKILIKKYPPLTCTMGEIERLLDQLETLDGFIPDIIINDYTEKMKIPFGEWRKGHITEYTMHSKRIADERKLLWLTASQVNRAGLRKRIPDQTYIAEDINKLGDVDMIFAITQDRDQAVLNHLNWYIMVNRHGPQDFGVTSNYNYDMGQIYMSQWPMIISENDAGQNRTPPDEQ